MTATWQIIEGDCRDTLRSLEPGSVQTCVTSPPYFGLRDYGHDGQIGLEPTPDEFVAALVGVFREVRRVLRDDGTVWLNLGDSYSASAPGATADPHARSTFTGGIAGPRAGRTGNRDKSRIPGVKPKDLLGIPWECAKALRAPYYSGRIAVERDRVWLAAILDAEGSICGFTHERADDGSTRTGVHVTITNTSQRLLDEAHRIWPASRSEHENHGVGHLGSRPSWRWICHGAENKAALMRELFPYLVAKRDQACLAYTFAALSMDAKRLGHSPQRDEVRDKRAWLVDAMSRLNRGEDFDFPAWVQEPPSLFEPGWYLRSDIIWSKLNPMPESVTDRPTKAHEYVFLLSKGPRYFYDADAIREAETGHSPGSHNGVGRADGPTWSHSPRVIKANGRNKRSVWTVATQPFPGAHFATFPPKLIEPCILAGSSPRACGECGAPWRRVVEREKHPERDVEAQRAYYAARTGRTDGAISGPGGMVDVTRTVGWEPSCAHQDDTGSSVVLDPFAGAGTTGMVALRHGRSFVGCELKPEYVRLARDRIIADSPLLNTHAEAAA